MRFQLADLTLKKGQGHQNLIISFPCTIAVSCARFLKIYLYVNDKSAYNADLRVLLF